MPQLCRAINPKGKAGGIENANILQMYLVLYLAKANQLCHRSCFPTKACEKQPLSPLADMQQPVA